MLNHIQKWAEALKRDTTALYLAARDPRTPWYAKGLVVIIVAYALSPIDLIPDFIPVLGYLDDLLLVPLGLWLAVRLIPADVMKECRLRGTELAENPIGKKAAVTIVIIWLAAAAIVGWLIYKAVRPG